MTIDVAFIGGLPADDLLFIAEFSPAQQLALGVNLPPFDPMNASVPAFEDPDLMRDRGLILENIQGFDVDVGTGLLINEPVFRAPPSLFNLSATAPYGLNGNFANLRDFAVGAVRQHFPKTLDRAVGADFRLPTEFELDALEAFMLSLESPADGNLKVSGPNSILSTPDDPRAKDTDRAEVRGRDLFSSVGCASCHKRSQTAFSGNTLNTGVELLNDFAPEDTGDGSGRFQTTGLFGLRKAAFFHNNAVVGLQNAVAFYVSAEFQASPNVGFVGPMSAADIQDITAFLLAISQE